MYMFFHSTIYGYQSIYFFFSWIVTVCLSPSGDMDHFIILTLNCRAFMERELPVFKQSNPQLEVETEMIRGQHPHLKAFYSKTKLSDTITKFDVLL